MKALSRVRLFATPWTAAHQAPPSLGLSRQEHWGGAPLPGGKGAVPSDPPPPPLYPELRTSSSSATPFLGNSPPVASPPLSPWLPGSKGGPPHLSSASVLPSPLSSENAPRPVWISLHHVTRGKAVDPQTLRVLPLSYKWARLLLSHFSRVRLCATP